MMAALRWIDDNLERGVILVNYTGMAAIIFVEVIRRFAFNEQAAWSTTIPIYLFLWVVWMGCAYNVKTRTHLRFDELRAWLPYKAQMACLALDAALWIAFSLVVVFYTSEQVLVSRENFAIVQGTDNVMQWWFYLATPVAFALLIVRVVQNFFQDIGRYRRGEPLDLRPDMFGEDGD
jgi:TRAP-type C4-dicarboxylate transport system permease small subunit